MREHKELDNFTCELCKNKLFKNGLCYSHYYKVNPTRRTLNKRERLRRAKLKKGE